MPIWLRHIEINISGRQCQTARLTNTLSLSDRQGMYRVHSLRNIARLMRGYCLEGDDFDWEIMGADLESSEDVTGLKNWLPMPVLFVGEAV